MSAASVGGSAFDSEGAAAAAVAVVGSKTEKQVLLLLLMLLLLQPMLCCKADNFTAHCSLRSPEAAINTALLASLSFLPLVALLTFLKQKETHGP